MAQVECVDSQTVIYGIQRKETAENKQFIERATSLFEMLKAKKIVVYLPTVVVTEYVAGFELDEQDEASAVLYGQFRIAPFDWKASRITARLRREATDARDRGELTEIKRGNLLPDCQILGTAIAVEAKRLYSNDEDLHKLSLLPSAKGIIEVCHLPVITKQLELEDATAANGHLTKLIETAKSDTLNPKAPVKPRSRERK